MPNQFLRSLVFTILILMPVTIASAQQKKETKGQIEPGDVSIRFSNDTFSNSIGSLFTSTKEFDKAAVKFADSIEKAYRRAQEQGGAPENSVDFLLWKIKRWSGKSYPSRREMIAAVSKQFDSFRTEFYANEQGDTAQPLMLTAFVLNFDPVELMDDLYPLIEQDLRDIEGEEALVSVREMIKYRHSLDGFDYVTIGRPQRESTTEIKSNQDRREMHFASAELDTSGKYLVAMGNDVDRVLDCCAMYQEKGSKLIGSENAGTILSIRINGELLSRDNGPRDAIEGFGFDPDEFFQSIQLRVTNSSESTSLQITFEMANADDAEPLKNLIESFVMMAQLTDPAIPVDAATKTILYELLTDVDVSASDRIVTARLNVKDEQMLTLVLSLMNMRRDN